MLIANRKRRDKSNQDEDDDGDKNDSFDFILFVGKHLFETALLFYPKTTFGVQAVPSLRKSATTPA
jgi:hypothetical protein